ncbi:MAG: hypothetical protein NC093_03380 [Alistipes sp.]|nr:hypothetical protein [Alistipes sp.]
MIFIPILLFLIPLAMLYVPDFVGDIKEKIAINDGKLSAGYYKDYKGENYQKALITLESIGFTNIKEIDLEDEGFLKKDGDVVSISINGNEYFVSSDYFEKDVPIVITYH